MFTITQNTTPPQFSSVEEAANHVRSVTSLASPITEVQIGHRHYRVDTTPGREVVNRMNKMEDPPCGLFHNLRHFFNRGATEENLYKEIFPKLYDEMTQRIKNSYRSGSDSG